MPTDPSIDYEFENAMVSYYADIDEVEFIPDRGVHARMTLEELRRLTGYIARSRRDRDDAAA